MVNTCSQSHVKVNDTCLNTLVQSARAQVHKYTYTIKDREYCMVGMDLCMFIFISDEYDFFFFSSTESGGFILSSRLYIIV